MSNSLVCNRGGTDRFLARLMALYSGPALQSSTSLSNNGSLESAVSDGAVTVGHRCKGSSGRSVSCTIEKIVASNSES